MLFSKSNYIERMIIKFKIGLNAGRTLEEDRIKKCILVMALFSALVESAVIILGLISKFSIYLYFLLDMSVFPDEIKLELITDFENFYEKYKILIWVFAIIFLLYNIFFKFFYYFDLCAKRKYKIYFNKKKVVYMLLPLYLIEFMCIAIFITILSFRGIPFSPFFYISLSIAIRWQLIFNLLLYQAAVIEETYS